MACRWLCCGVKGDGSRSTICSLSGVSYCIVLVCGTGSLTGCWFISVILTRASMTCSFGWVFRCSFKFMPTCRYSVQMGHCVRDSIFVSVFYVRASASGEALNTYVGSIEFTISVCYWAGSHLNDAAQNREISCTPSSFFLLTPWPKRTTSRARCRTIVGPTKTDARSTQYQKCE